MKAAMVSEIGTPPVYGDFQDPTPVEGTCLVTVAASALSHLTRSRASGTHYSSSGKLPFIPGVDGTGVREDGRRVYFVMPEAPFGGMAEQTLVSPSHCIELPDGLDAIQAAAIANPGMSSWAALRERARLAAGETVLINGATGISGRLAVQVARHLGASKVIATGRNSTVLAALGVDATVSLTQEREALERDFGQHFSQGVNVVLDYLWGESAEILLGAAARNAPEAVPIRFVQIGSVSASTLSLSSSVLRSSSLELMGSGLNSVPFPRLLNAVKEFLAAVGPGGFQIATKSVPLAEVTEYWAEDDSSRRLVFTTGRGLS